MPYRLGIDIGTTFTAAAVCRPGATVQSELVPLGTRSTSVPSVLFLDEDILVVGEAAERRAVTDPERVVRDFKRRMGDGTPILVGDRPYHAHDLVALLARWVVDRVTEREGSAPDSIAVTYPAAWGPHRESLLRNALDTAGVTATLLTEPQAAALQYASASRVEPGSTFAVYDLGGGTFDAVVVRKTAAGSFDLLGPAGGIDQLGGIDIDDAIVDHVLADLPEPSDPMVMARLRRDCTEAKEALSSDTETTIPVLEPRTQVRLCRAEFDKLVRPILDSTVHSLRRAIQSADVDPADLTSVLLVGGSSRIPLVSTLITSAIGRPVAVDADPKGVVALGAALAAHHAVAPPVETLPIPAPRRPDHDTTPPDLRRPRTHLRRTKIVLTTLAMLLLALAVFPSPFSSKTGTSPTNNPDQQPAGAANPPGTPPPGATQPGVTKKRTPGQPVTADKAPTATKDSPTPLNAPQPAPAEQVRAAAPNNAATPQPPPEATAEQAPAPREATSEAPPPPPPPPAPPVAAAPPPPPPTPESTPDAPPPPSTEPSPPPPTSNPPTS